MENNVIPIPVWKRDATPEERLLEVAHMARQHPERFGKILVVYEETQKDGATVVRYTCNGATTTELLGLLELGKEEILDVTRRNKS